MRGMMLHCGANQATYDEVAAVHTPDPTDTHYPIPHLTLVEKVHEHVTSNAFEIVEHEYGLWGEDGERMFGLLKLVNRNDPTLQDPSSSLMVAIRNSHDKSMSTGVAAGDSVFVCDNLAISGDLVTFRKHTRFILNDLDRLLADLAGNIAEAQVNTARRYEAYRGFELDDAAVHDLLIRSVDAKVMSNATIAKVLHQWRDSEHEEFAPRTAWSLFNAYTETFKGSNPLNLGARTGRLHGLLDMVSNAFGVAEGTPVFGGEIEAVEEEPNGGPLLIGAGDDTEEA